MYDPLGRLWQTSGGAAGTIRFVYDGDELVAEYNSGGPLLRRYVHGSGVDDPVVWYEGAGLTNPRWLTADHQGSIVGISQATTTLGLNSYDEYGIPATANIGRFQYTGQAWIPELRMYHYKARIYSPTLGRFLQTDPVGYEDDLNLYGYVGNEPINGRDPTGQCAACQDEERAFDESLQGMSSEEMQAAISNRAANQLPALLTVSSLAIAPEMLIARGIPGLGRLLGIGTSRRATTAVLGHYPAYVNLAEKNGSSLFLDTGKDLGKDVACAAMGRE